MANFFQPSVSPGESTATPSEASQAKQKFDAQLLQMLLNNMAGSQPTFGSFVHGGPARTPLPSGMGAGLSDVLAAMNQPGAFTSHMTGLPSQTTPSQFSDLASILGLGGLLSYTPLGAWLGNQAVNHILDPIGGWLHLGSNNPTTPTSDFLGSLSSGDIPGINYTPDPSGFLASLTSGDIPDVNFTPAPDFFGMSYAP